ncbi:hypothetical protein KR038_002252 [Drosophila bunnanda]|nr:hypothetical protein KR038_002252 [Drosophila bunnanda]
MLAVALTMAALVLASQQDICGAQLSIHTDSNTNSFSLKAPGLQQTFTRYYGAARTQPQEAQEQPQQEQALVLQQQQQQQQQALLQQQQQQQDQLYRFSRLRGGGKPKADQFIAAVQQQQQLSLQQQQQQLNLQQQQQLLQQQALLAQSSFGSPAAGTVSGSGAGVSSYADQMHTAFLDYQRQRVEFEQQQQRQQQQQLLQKLYNYYPDASGAQVQQQHQQPAEGANGFVYQRPQFLQAGASVSGPAAGFGPQRDFYSTQQQQDLLRDQQQLVAQQFPTSQTAPSTRQSSDMAVPVSSAPSAPTFQPSSDVSHVSFSSGNLKYNF